MASSSRNQLRDLIERLRGRGRLSADDQARLAAYELHEAHAGHGMVFYDVNVLGHEGDGRRGDRDTLCCGRGGILRQL